VVRMAKDFGDDVLPLRWGGFLPASHLAPTDEDDWPDIISQIEQLQLNCLAVLGVPGWARVGQNMGMSMEFLPP